MRVIKTSKLPEKTNNFINKLGQLIQNFKKKQKKTFCTVFVHTLRSNIREWGVLKESRNRIEIYSLQTKET